MIGASYKKSHNLDGKNYLLGSILFHLVFLGFFLFLPQSIRELLLGSRDQKVIREFVQVDLVGMPKFTIKELKKLAPEVDISKEAAKEPSRESPIKNDSEIDKASNSKPQKSLENFFSSMSKKKLPSYKKKKETSGKRNLNKESSIRRIGKLERLALEGNSLSRGAVSVGENTGFSDDDYQIYISGIPSQVRPFWSLPSYLSDKNLRARVKLRIDGGGRVISLELIESSGVEEFDQRALQSIKSVKIFTTPSKSIRELLAIKGVILGFPL